MYKKVHFIFEALPFIYILKEDPHRRTTDKYTANRNDYN